MTTEMENKKDTYNNKKVFIFYIEYKLIILINLDAVRL